MDEENKINDTQTDVVIESANTAPETPDNSTSKNKKTIIIAIAAVAAVAVIIAVIFIVRGIRSGNKPEENTAEGSGIINDLTNPDGSLLSDAEILSKIEEESDPELLSKLAEATTKFRTETGTGSTNQIVAATTASAAASTTKAGSATAATTTAANGNANQGATQAPATTANNNNQGSEPTTAAPAPTTAANNGNTANKEQADAAVTQIKAFYDRKCYFEGTMFENGQGSPMSMAFDGDDYEVFTQLDGIEISIMKKDGKFYMKRPAVNQYVELDETLLTTLGLSLDDINVNFGAKDFNSLQTDSIFDVTINGANGVCYQYKTENGYSDFYAVDGQLKQIEIKDSNLITQTQLQINVFSTSIPSDQLTLNGYDKAKSIFSMLADMM